jgi:hypothetical protein
MYILLLKTLEGLPRALARLEFICERVEFRFHIPLYLFVWESLKFRVYID